MGKAGIQPDDEEERTFWMAACRPSMEAVWGNTDDDVYAQLLEVVPVGCSETKTKD
jgi:hypothetical protein